MTERETEVGSTFHFILSLHVVFSNKRCQRQTGVFTVFHFCAEFLLRDAVRCSVCAQRRTI